MEEKITLTCGRDGGLQNMEVLGMVTLRVADDKNGRIRLIINNNDSKGLQLQVGPPSPPPSLLHPELRSGSHSPSPLADTPQRGQEAVHGRVRHRAEEPGEVLPSQQRRGRAEVEATDHRRVPHTANQ